MTTLAAVLVLGGNPKRAPGTASSAELSFASALL
jgi:hypothetical protein